MAVRVRLRGESRPQRSACAGTVVYDYLLSEAVGQFLPHEARDGVGDASGSECDYHAYRARRVLLCLSRCREPEERAARQCHGG
jgi:hypothetical protein